MEEQEFDTSGSMTGREEERKVEDKSDLFD
jgi:hypothetical protein